MRPCFGAIAALAVVVFMTGAMGVAPELTASFSQPAWSGHASFLPPGSLYVRVLRTTRDLAHVYTRSYNFTAHDASATAWHCDVGEIDVSYEVRDRDALVGSPGCTAPRYFACELDGFRCKCDDAQKWHKACAQRVWSDFIRNKTSEQVFKLQPAAARAELLRASSEQCTAYGTVATVWTTPKLKAPFSNVDEKLELISTARVHEQADDVTAASQKRAQMRERSAAVAVAETQSVAARGDAAAAVIAAGAQYNVTVTVAAGDAQAKQLRLDAEFASIARFIATLEGADVAETALTAWAVHAKPGAAYLGSSNMSPHISATPP